MVWSRTLLHLLDVNEEILVYILIKIQMCILRSPSHNNYLNRGINPKNQGWSRSTSDPTHILSWRPWQGGLVPRTHVAVPGTPPARPGNRWSHLSLPVSSCQIRLVFSSQLLVWWKRKNNPKIYSRRRRMEVSFACFWIKILMRNLSAVFNFL